MYCSESFSKNTIGRHLLSCKERQSYFADLLQKDDDKHTKDIEERYTNVNIFLLKIFSPDQPEYWLFAEFSDNCLLSDLDSFLRDIWLECCGHLSSFTIDNQTYESQIDEFTKYSKTMRIKLNKILQTGMSFEYIYDYGSSTELIIKVISFFSSIMNKKEKVIKIAARNNEIQFNCIKCQKEKATEICTVCLYEAGRIHSSFCNRCIKQHKCGEEMALPIANSPRSGVCGYTGDF
jgi:hypothetical protein